MDQYTKKNKKYTSSNIGLHCHCAEDEEHFLKLLEIAKQEHVGVLDINNYRSLKVYTEVLPKIAKEKLSPYKEIKLVPSIEMPGAFSFENLDGKAANIEVHILAYGVDVSKEEMLEEFVKTKYKSLNQEEELQRLIKIGHNIGLEFKDEDCYLDVNDDNRKFAGRAFTQGIMKNMDANFCKKGEESTYKLSYELRTDWRAFQNICVKDINSPFYLDIASLNPSVEEVIKLIHDMDGKAYLAHPSAYFSKSGSEEDIDKAYKNTIKFAEDFMSKFSPQNGIETCIDGVEVYHPSYLGNLDVMSEMRELVKKFRLATSGGTDIHVDQTLGKNETVSSDSIGGNITKRKLREFNYLRNKSKPVLDLREDIIEMQKKKESDIER